MNEIIFEAEELCLDNIMKKFNYALLFDIVFVSNKSFIIVENEICHEILNTDYNVLLLYICKKLNLNPYKIKAGISNKLTPIC